MFFKNLVLKSDLTSAPASLRIKGQSHYESICGGLSSIATLSAFLVIFIIIIIGLFQLQNITYDQKLLPDLDTSSQIFDFYFMIGFMGLEAYQLQDIFEVSLFKMPVDTNHTPFLNPIMQSVTLQRCNSTYLQTLGIFGVQIYAAQSNMSNYFCPIYKSRDMLIRGSYLLSDAQILILNINNCVNSTYNNNSCADPTYRDQFISNVTAISDFILVNLLFVNTLITPTQKNPVIKTIKGDSFVTIGSGFGMRGALQLIPYTIQTDESFLPWSETTELAGYFMNDMHISAVPTNNGVYFNLLIFKSLSLLTIQRQFGKIDDSLSYIGGLFALIFVLVEFLISPYNEFKYQLLIAQNSFESEVLTKYSQDKINFLVYLKIKLYLILNEFGILFKQTKQFKQLQKIQEEATYMIDPRFILRRVNHLQNKTKSDFSKDQEICLELSRLPTYKQIKRKRKLNFISQVFNIHNQNIGQVYPIFDNSSDTFQFNKQSNKQTIQLSSSDQQNQQIKQEVKNAIKKFKNHKYTNKFHRFYQTINKRQIQLNLNQNIEQDEQSNAKILNVLSNIKNKLCQICHQVSPNFLPSCGHFFHIRCIHEWIKNAQINQKTNQNRFKQDKFLFFQQQAKEDQNKQNVDANCPFCEIAMNLILIRCQQCKQNWQQHTLKKSELMSQKQIKKLQEVNCNSCLFNKIN